MALFSYEPESRHFVGSPISINRLALLKILQDIIQSVEFKRFSENAHAVAFELHQVPA